jgi:predicted nucleic acid-binding Zn ribbon protein
VENVGDDRSVDGCDPQAAPAGTAGAAADPARSLLRQVRDAQGSAPTSRRTRRAGGRAPERAPDRAPARGQEPGRNRGGYSGAGPDPRSDPQPVGRLLDALITDQGWDRPLADARVFAEWAQLVGADVAAHCTPQSLRDGELRIVAESTAWATQLRLLSRQLLGRLAAELGSGVVRRVSISGPVAPSWKHGNRSVRGARGPRDTYG